MFSAVDEDKSSLWTLDLRLTPFYFEPIVGPLNAGRQTRRVTPVLNVVRNMGQVSSPGFDLLDVLDGFVQPKVRRVFFEP